MSWSAETYLAFEEERSRAGRDLVTQIPDPGLCEAVDLGCGPGNSTELLRHHLPSATIEGVDSSPDMITAAKARLPEVAFTLADIGQWNPPGPYGAILANASLQWLPDHAALLPHLISKLSPEGTLAVQMPDNLDEPVHVLMRETAANGPWAEKMAPVIAGRGKLETAEWYYRVLRGHASRVDVWRTTYYHVLPGPAAIIDWFKGAGLRPYLAKLDLVEQNAFLTAYFVRLAPHYPPATDGTVLLPFPRLFFTARR